MLLLLWFVVEDHDTLFILSESVHFVGIGLLAYKLIKKRAAGGEPRRRAGRPLLPVPCRHRAPAGRLATVLQKRSERACWSCNHGA